MPKEDLDAIERLLRIRAGMSEGGVDIDDLQALRQIERDAACRQLEEMAEQFKQRDETRRKLWGNKFPLRLGDKPPENGKPFNRVKTKKRKTRRTGGKARK